MNAYVRRWHLLTTMVVMIAISGLGYALATIPDSNGVIHGCYIPSQNNKVRVIDTDAGQRCRSGQIPLNWNQTGPPGADGTPEAIFAGYYNAQPNLGTTPQYFDLFTGTACGANGAINTGLSGCQQPVPAAATMMDLHVYSVLVQGSGSLLFTVFKNGSATGLSCALTEAQPTCSSSTSVSFASGDLVALEIKETTGNGASVLQPRWTGVL